MYVFTRTLLFLLTTSFLFACSYQHSVRTQDKQKKGNPIVQIHFVRSGGFAGQATNVEGNVVFNRNQAQVVSDASKYKRELAPDEAQHLLGSARECHTVTVSPPNPVRDGYQ